LETLKIRVALYLLLFTIQSFAQTTEYTTTGEYQGKNIYIQNPLSSDKINFCTTEVYLNERLINSAPKTSAFVIELSHLQVGDPVFIKIVHRDGCEPKIINPQVIRSKSKFQFMNSYADAISIHWTTTGELPYGKFFIEHYKNKNWVNIQTLNGKGAFDANQYSIKPEHHTGDNKYRIKYVQNDGKIFFSRVFDYFHDVEPISFFPTLVVDKITLSRESDYTIVDSYGNEITQGKGLIIDLNSLKEGLYFLHVDNREEKFVKK
jgi:hypothetical protein